MKLSFSNEIFKKYFTENYSAQMALFFATNADKFKIMEFTATHKVTGKIERRYFLKLRDDLFMDIFGLADHLSQIALVYSTATDCNILTTVFQECDPGYVIFTTFNLDTRIQAVKLSEVLDTKEIMKEVYNPISKEIRGL